MTMTSDLDLAINNGLVVTPAGRARVNIGVLDGRINTLSVGPLEARDAVDATGKVVLPGAIDPHVHFRMYQRDVVTCDDYASGSISAAFGGVTTYIDFAVQPSGSSAVEAFKERFDEASGVSAIDFAFHSALTTPTDRTLAEISELVALGVRSFKFFMTYRKFRFYTDLGFLLEAMREIARLGAVALIHAENDEILEHLKDKFLAEGKTGIEYLALHRPDYAEEIAIADTASVARATNCEVSVVHLSSQRGLQAVLRGRENGAQYWAETCPQYLVLSRDLLARADGALYTFTPTMKEASDSEALWAGLRSGAVTYVGSDHSPFDRAVKLAAQTFEQIYPGIPGTETLLPLLFSEGVSAGRLSLERLAEVSSGSTARVFQLVGKGGIQLGNDADLVVFDPSREVVLARDVLHSRCDYTPYDGMTVHGYPVVTISRGEIIMRDGEFVGRPGRGRFVERKARSIATERAAVPA
jgi:dihydropyrimidinase